MRVAVISDVHGNLRALERVLEEIVSEGVDLVWCLGDTVGYGPRPNECCVAVAGRADVCLVGNHDLLALGKDVTEEDFNTEALVSGSWTRSILSEESRGFLDALGPEAHVEGVDLFHGSARDPVWEYVLSAEAALATLQLVDAPIALVGHSHVPLAILLEGGELFGGHAPAGTTAELGRGSWLLNPGAVGQPRDGDPRAAWLLLDLGAGLASFHRVVYPVAQTQAEVREAQLPEALAERLAAGV